MDCGLEPFYVGKGQRDRELYHLTQECLANDCNLHKVNTVKKIVKRGLTPVIIRVFESDIESLAYAEEKRLIALFGRRDLKTGVLTNLTDGGEGKVGYVTPEETKNRISRARANWLLTLDDQQRKVKLGTMRNKKHTPQALDKMSIGVRLACQRPETKASRSAANSGKNNPRAKPIEVAGSKYACIKDACEALGLSKYHLKKDPSFRYL